MPTADDFVEVTTRSARKRHWAPAGHPDVLCGSGRRYTQAEHDADNHQQWRRTIADLPPCASCDRSRQRRIDGRGH